MFSRSRYRIGDGSGLSLLWVLIAVFLVLILAAGLAWGCFRGRDKGRDGMVNERFHRSSERIPPPSGPLRVGDYVKLTKSLAGLDARTALGRIEALGKDREHRAIATIKFTAGPLRDVALADLRRYDPGKDV
ncbi:hypothetical protein AB0K00_13360 [Dactylosporangium sp. NPDC049525]|uniref:hypothetical protein n=1 Tax=Dactylosporangium sp. NPDC049525 TaxID=3154730 RepID=UPI0034258530